MSPTRGVGGVVSGVNKGCYAESQLTCQCFCSLCLYVLTVRSSLGQ